MSMLLLQYKFFISTWYKLAPKYNILVRLSSNITSFLLKKKHSPVSSTSSFTFNLYFVIIYYIVICILIIFFQKNWLVYYYNMIKLNSFKIQLSLGKQLSNITKSRRHHQYKMNNNLKITFFKTNKWMWSRT